MSVVIRLRVLDATTIHKRLSHCMQPPVTSVCGGGGGGGALVV